MMRKKLLPRALFLFILLFLAAERNAFSLVPITVQLNWKYQFEFAGYIAALEKGFYRDAGLKVILKQYNGGSVINDVLRGRADFGVSDSEIFSYIILGKPVVLLANFFKRSPLVLATKPSIMTPLDLRNKRIMADENEFKYSSLGLLLKKFHIKLKDLVLTKETYSIKPFIEGKVDAICIYLTNQPYYLNKLHVKYNIIDPSNYGIFAYAGNLFTSRGMLKRHPELVRKFVTATIAGWKYALKHKNEIINIIYSKYSKSKSIPALKYEASRIEDIMMPDVFPVGSIQKSVVEEIVYGFEDIMGINRKRIRLSDFIYSPSSKRFLTREELNFIKTHRTIRICTNPDWAPIEYLNDKGKPAGISIEVLKKISRMTGLRFVRVPTNSWAQSQVYLRQHRCDMLPSAVSTIKRREYALFTKPYLRYELFIFAKNDKKFVGGIEPLLNKPMARKRGSGLIQKLKRLYPKIKIIETETYEQSFEYVDNGKAYYTVATLPVADYYINKCHLNDIVIIGDTGMSYEIRMAVRKDMPLLVDILNKALSRITKRSLNQIYSREINKERINKLKYAVFKVFAISMLLVVFLSVVIMYIHRKNRQLNSIKQRLEESLQNFRTLVQHSIQIAIIYKDGVCIDANNVACKTLGYSRSELIGKHVFELFTKESAEIVKEKLKEEHTEPYEVEFVRKDGEIVYALAKGDYITLSGRKVRLGTAVDITQVKKLQAELEQLNATLEERIRQEIEKNRMKDTLMMQQSKLAAMGELLSMIAHQWRQPLNTISASINSLLLKLEMGTVDSEAIIEKLQQMSEYVKHLSATIDDFRNFFRPDKQKVRVKIDELIENVLMIASEAIESQGIRIEKHIRCERELETYANELKHAVLNIINNARDVLLERHIKNPVIRIGVLCEGDTVIITVTDNGGGIDPAIMEKIFEPYFSTKDKKNGTGLGLYMTKIIVEDHLKGRISVRNTDSGAEFTIKLKA